MQINLNQEEIHEALTEYVSNQGFDTSGKDVIVTLKAGRKIKDQPAKGYSAIIQTVPKGTVAEDVETSDENESSGETPAIDFTDK